MNVTYVQLGYINFLFQHFLERNQTESDDVKVDTQENQKAVLPIVLTAILVIAALAILLIFRQLPTMSLSISIVLYLVIDIGFLFAMFLGIRTKKMSIVLFSVLANGVFFLVLSGFIFLLMVANGISEP